MRCSRNRAPLQPDWRSCRFLSFSMTGATPPSTFTAVAAYKAVFQSMGGSIVGPNSPVMLKTAERHGADGHERLPPVGLPVEDRPDAQIGLVGAEASCGYRQPAVLADQFTRVSLVAALGRDSSQPIPAGCLYNLALVQTPLPVGAVQKRRRPGVAVGSGPRGLLKCACNFPIRRSRSWASLQTRRGAHVTRRGRLPSGRCRKRPLDSAASCRGPARSPSRSRISRCAAAGRDCRRAPSRYVVPRWCKAASCAWLISPAPATPVN